VLCLPTVYRESKGLSVLEAWANGVPAVLPRHGAFPEMVAATGGGLLHEPLDPGDVAKKLAVLLRDKTQNDQMGQAARRSVSEKFHAPAMAEQTRRLYAELMAATRTENAPREIGAHENCPPGERVIG